MASPEPKGPIIELSNQLKLSVSERLISRGLAIFGMRGSGKSYTCGVIAEELARIGQPFIVIDIMGEYYTLREKFPVLIVGLKATDYTDLHGLRPEHAEPLAKLVVENGLSLVLDLSRGTMLEKVSFLADFLEALYKVEEEARRPYVLIVDEAHRIAPEKGLPRLDRISKALKKAFYWLYEIAATGRHIGIGLVITVRRPAEISKSVLAQAEVKIVHKLTDPTDLKKLHEEGLPSELDEVVRSLEPGEAVVLGLGEPFVTKIKERACSHGGETPLIEPVKSPDLERAIRALAEALGLEGREGGLPIPEAPTPPPTPPAHPKGLEGLEGLETGPELPEFSLITVDYPLDIVANYLSRMMIYGQLDVLVPRSTQCLASRAFATEDAGEVLRALAIKLAEAGWSLKGAGEEGKRFLLAYHGGVAMGLAAARAEDGEVVAIVVSAPTPPLLDSALSSLRALMAEACPGARELEQ